MENGHTGAAVENSADHLQNAAILMKMFNQKDDQWSNICSVVMYCKLIHSTELSMNGKQLIDSVNCIQNEQYWPLAPDLRGLIAYTNKFYDLIDFVIQSELPAFVKLREDNKNEEFNKSCQLESIIEKNDELIAQLLAHTIT